MDGGSKNTSLKFELKARGSGSRRKKLAEIYRVELYSWSVDPTGTKYPFPATGPSTCRENSFTPDLCQQPGVKVNL